jgi:hypothetical protein
MPLLQAVLVLELVEFLDVLLLSLLFGEALVDLFLPRRTHGFPLHVEMLLAKSLAESTRTESGECRERTLKSNLPSAGASLMSKPFPIFP